jgi:hypothetical protein
MGTQAMHPTSGKGKEGEAPSRGQAEGGAKMIDAILSFLNSPVLRLVYIPPTDLQYAFVTLGGMLILVLFPWVVFCVAIRNGIDGWKAVARAIQHKKPLLLRKILIGAWKPLPFYDPIKAKKNVQGL